MTFESSMCLGGTLHFWPLCGCPCLSLGWVCPIWGTGQAHNNIALERICSKLPVFLEEADFIVSVGIVGPCSKECVLWDAYHCVKLRDDFIFKRGAGTYHFSGL